MGPVNDKNTPADFPRNEFTAMIEAVAQRNQRGTSLSPEAIAAGVPITGTPLPSARSANIGRTVETAPEDDPNRPLTAQEIEALNKEAIASGMVVGPVNPGIARVLDGTGEDLGQYGSLEEAIAAGAPVGADADAISEGAAQFREVVPTSPTVQVRAPRTVPPTRMTAREAVASAQIQQLPRLPDFSKVQMIDMVNGKVYVDNVEFALEAPEIKMLRKFCITTAKDQIQKALDAALKKLAEDETDGGAEAV